LTLINAAFLGGCTVRPLRNDRPPAGRMREQNAACAAVSAAGKPSMKNEEIENKLKTMKADLQRRLSAINADLGAALDPDSEDRITQIENDQVLTEMRREASEQISSIEAALERLKRGSFGLCVRCLAPIDRSRLDAIPYTPLCVTCARLADERLSS
jgi:RNA polymerase-binding transcription factor DksA